MDGRAYWRRRVRRHLFLAGLSALLTGWTFYAVRSPDSMFRLSMASAYAGLALLGASLVAGAWNILTHRPNPVSTDLRRDIGIWAGLLGLAHVVVGLQVHMGGRFWLYFVFPDRGERLVPIRYDAFGLANFTGLGATLVLLLLLLMSNDWSLRRLGPRRWKAVQRWNYAGFGLVVAHSVLYQVVERRQAGFVAVFLGIVLVVLALQLAGYRQRSGVSDGRETARQGMGQRSVPPRAGLTIALLVGVLVPAASVAGSELVAAVADVLEPSRANPILRRGQPGEFDAVKVGPRVVLKEGAGLYKMWYEGVPGANRASVGYATSKDGLTWKKWPGNPVLAPSERWEGGEKGEISPNTVLLEGGAYRMWYHSWDGRHRRVGYATSPDGLEWTKHPGNPVLDVGERGSWDASQVAVPTVLRVGDRYLMWYAGMSERNDGWRIGLATSPDGVRWTKNPRNPVFKAGPPGAWDEWAVLPGGMVWDGTRFHLWYPAFNRKFRSGIGYASSADGLHWTRSPKNPVLSRSEAVPAECREPGDTATAYIDDDGYRVIYGGWNDKYWSMCMAVGPLGPR